MKVTGTMGLRPMSGASGVLAGLALYGLKRVPVVAEDEANSAPKSTATVPV